MGIEKKKPIILEHLYGPGDHHGERGSLNDHMETPPDEEPLTGL